ncbi:hypothetical protein HMPREF1548_05239 [Clostridium sp. KLE 1755]|nr:hypothetical protein HMPREF1548_05239 [Clostridium sp. KLE 1755]
MLLPDWYNVNQQISCLNRGGCRQSELSTLQRIRDGRLPGWDIQRS